MENDATRGGVVADSEPDAIVCEPYVTGGVVEADGVVGELAGVGGEGGGRVLEEILDFIQCGSSIW